jgi:hypothetical protein
LPDSVGTGNSQTWTQYSSFPGGPGIYNGVDSLTYSYRSAGFGTGCQVLYILRFRIADRWYLNSAIGPWVNINFSRYRNVNENSPHSEGSRSVSADFHPLLISDFSISYRF